MTSFAQMAAVEQSMVGVMERGGPDGHSGNIIAFWDEIGEHWNQGQPWCGAFQNAMAARVGLSIPLLVSTVDGARSFQENKQWYTKGLAGDFVFFDWYGTGIDHIGWVLSANADGTYTTVEGNTSPGATDDVKYQQNGGMVAKRIRKSNIAGFGRPVYTFGPLVHPVVIRKTNPFNRHDSLVKWTQWALHVPVDGIPGPQTKAALAAFRARNGILPANGPYPDSRTQAALAVVTHS